MQCFQEVIDNNARLVDKLYYAISLIQVAKMNMNTSPAEAIKYLSLVQPLVFNFDNAFKSQARAYIKYLAEKDSSLSSALTLLEEPQETPLDDEGDDTVATQQLEKMLGEENGDKE